MLEQAVLTSVRAYISALKAEGLDVEAVVVFGSQCTGKANKWSDIDLIVIAPQFDTLKDRQLVNLLWRVAAKVDNRIEPIPCGSRQWREDDTSVLFQIARQQGEILAA
ncbi:MAG: hypothetical protein Tsb0017_27520 [Geothermobacteraceae bacterium]